jgi:hypothetical protein
VAVVSFDEATDSQGGDVARPLTPDELTRYPWASQISDYVPVGRMRTWGLLLGLGGLVVVLIGAIVSLASAVSIHHAVNMHHLATALGVYIGAALIITAAALGAITLVQGIVQRASIAVLLWSIMAIVPLLVMVLVVRPIIH